MIAGYGIAIPVGAIGTYLVALTARTTLKVGAAAALGVATADGLYALIATLGGSAIAPALAPITTPLKWISVAVLLALAARGATLAITHHRRLQSTQPIPPPPTPASAYFTLLGMTLLNPTTILYFTALVLGTHDTTTPTHNKPSSSPRPSSHRPPGNSSSPPAAPSWAASSPPPKLAS
nr:LysE family transporter [Kribbella italica]